MTLASIFLVVIIVSIILVKVLEEHSFWFLLLAAFCIIFFIVSFIGLCTRSVRYEEFVSEREGFIITLEAARKNNREIESAAIVHKVAEWNEKLSLMKYEQTGFFFGDFTDERIKDLPFIE